jgi:hypothetical protein
MMSFWNSLPVIVRAIIAGFLVSLFGSVPWSILLGANLSSPAFPWSVPVMGVYLWFLWRYLGGKGWSRSTSEARRNNLRACLVSRPVWLWSLLAGVFAVLSLIAGRVVAARLVHLPTEPFEDLSSLPSFTVVSLLLMTSVVAGMVEEAAFRGYLQAPIERRHGPVTAILVSATLFSLAHFPGNSSMSLPLLPFLFAAGVIYGLLAYLAGSILPGVILHASQDGIVLLLVRWLGPPPARPLVWETGTDLRFWIFCLAFILCGLAAIWAFRRLAISVPTQAGAPRSESSFPSSPQDSV